jgi:hypothetical protein
VTPFFLKKSYLLFLSLLFVGNYSIPRYTICFFGIAPIH